MNTNQTNCVTVAIAAALMASLITATGCNKASEKFSEKMIEKSIGDGAKVDLQDGKVTIKTKDGEFESSSGGSVKIPDGFPSDIYLVKDAQVVMAMKMPQGFQVMLQSKEPMDKVGAKFAEEMKGQGWTEETNMVTGDTTMMSYKKEKRTATVVISKDQSGSTIQVSATADNS